MLQHREGNMGQSLMSILKTWNFNNKNVIRSWRRKYVETLSLIKREEPVNSTNTLLSATSRLILSKGLEMDGTCNKFVRTN
jgi:hypothetical protein